MLLESTILDGRSGGRVGLGWGLDDNNTNSAQQELGLGLSLAKTCSATAEIDDGPHYNHETSFLKFSKNFEDRPTTPCI